MHITSSLIQILATEVRS